MTPRVVFILSTNYAGSHFLSLLLGSNTKARHLGELHRFTHRIPRKRPCYLCDDFRECPVFKGIEPGATKHIHSTIFKNVGPHVEVLLDNSKKTAWARKFLRAKEFE